MEQRTISEDVESGKERYKKVRDTYISGEMTDEQYETRVSYLMDQYGEEVINIDTSPDTKIDKFYFFLQDNSSYIYTTIVIAILTVLVETFSFPFILAATILAPVLPLILISVLAYLLWL